MTYLQEILPLSPFLFFGIGIGILWTKITLLERKIKKLDLYKLERLQEFQSYDIDSTIRYVDKMQYDTIKYSDFLYQMCLRDLQFEKEFGHLRKTPPQDQS